jgi:hypothetical protein
MNYRRGLFRIWLVATLVWVAFCLTLTPMGCRLINNTTYCSGYNWERPLLFAIAGPLVLLAVIYVLVWVGKGFAHK